MIVTDKKYFLDDNLVKKLNLIADRVTKQQLDALILVDGDEGYGKSNLSVGCAHYLSWKTGRKFDVSDIFFEPDKFIEEAKKTTDRIFIFDEAVLIAMAYNWQSKFQQKLITFMMMARKKRHIIFFNIPKFFRLNEYFVVDRAIALIHVYAQKEKHIGKFTYYKKEAKNLLYNECKDKRKRPYKDFYTFHGSFRELMSVVVDEEEYERRKDEAIERIGTPESKDLSKRDMFHVRLKYNLYKFMKEQGLRLQEMANGLHLDASTIKEWSNYPERHPNAFKFEEKEVKH